MNVKRGEIYWAELKPGYKDSSIQEGKKPVVIVSNELNNKYCKNVDVLVITSKIIKLDQPTHVLINHDSGLSLPSMAMAEQSPQIPKTVLGEYIGRCNEATMRKIEKAIQIQKGIVDPFNIGKALNLIKAIKMVHGYDISPQQAFIRETLIKELKTYCENYGKDYRVIVQIYKEKNIVENQKELNVQFA